MNSPLKQTPQILSAALALGAIGTAYLAGKYTQMEETLQVAEACEAALGATVERLDECHETTRLSRTLVESTDTLIGSLTSLKNTYRDSWSECTKDLLQSKGETNLALLEANQDKEASLVLVGNCTEDLTRSEESFERSLALLELHHKENTTPCTGDSLAQIRAASQWLTGHAELIIGSYDRFCPRERDLAGCSEIVREALPTVLAGHGDQYFCPTEDSTNEGSLLARAVRFREEDRPGQIAFYPRAFSGDFCEQVGTLAHERAHVVTSISHNEERKFTEDPVYLVGWFTEKECEFWVDVGESGQKNERLRKPGFLRKRR